MLRSSRLFAMSSITTTPFAATTAISLAAAAGALGATALPAAAAALGPSAIAAVLAAAAAAAALGTLNHLLCDHLLQRVVCKRSWLEPRLL